MDSNVHTHITPQQQPAPTEPPLAPAFTPTRDRRSELKDTSLSNTHCPERYHQGCEHPGQNMSISFNPVHSN